MRDALSQFDTGEQLMPNRVGLVFVCGLLTSFRPGPALEPAAFRNEQQVFAARIQERLPGWQVHVPERYSESSGASRNGTDTLQLRTWNAESVGVTRLPVGFLRFTQRAALVLVDGEHEVDVEVTLWADGSGVAIAEVAKRFEQDTSLDRIRDWVEASTFGCLDGQMMRAAREIVGESHVLQGDPDAADPAEVRWVGRHRIVCFDEAPDDVPVAELCSTFNAAELDQSVIDVGSDGQHALPANGVSLEVGQSSSSLLRPVCRYYQRWIAAVTALDDELYLDVLELSSAERTADHTRVLDRARFTFYEHHDVLNALSPLHLTAWKAYANSWRIGAIERDAMDKMAVVEELNSDIRATISNRIAARTGAVVTFLTALTLVSIVTGIAAFVLQEDSLTSATRWSLVGASFTAALTLFLLSIQPLLIRRVRRRQD